MKKPNRRSRTSNRRSENLKKRLLEEPSPDLIEEMMEKVYYKGSAKHKRNPKAFGLKGSPGFKGDATLCDHHADFKKSQMSEIPAMICRGLKAGLIGNGKRIIWIVSDEGWIFEARETIPGRNEYHGYPIMPEEIISHYVLERFSKWAETHGNPQDKEAAKACLKRYR